MGLQELATMLQPITALVQKAQPKPDGTESVPKPAKNEDMWDSVSGTVVDRIAKEEGFLKTPQDDVGTTAIGNGFQIRDDQGNPTAYYNRIGSLSYNKGKKWQDWHIEEADSKALLKQISKERTQDFLRKSGIKSNQLTPTQLIELSQWNFNAPYNDFEGVMNALRAGNYGKAGFEILNSLMYHKALLGKAGIDEADIRVGKEIKHFKNLTKLKGVADRWEKTARSLMGSDEDVAKAREQLKRKWGI